MSPARYPFSVAPMMDRTDRHFRFFMRQVTRRALLYTEMVVARAVQHGDRDRLLSFHPLEHPVALQLGGDDPAELAAAAVIGEDYGYDEINLNVGCPSDRVQQGRFGAALMADPERVAECVAAMKAAVRVPVTVKHRIGIDDRDAYEDMLSFVDRVAEAGPARFSIHARKAWLQGLSPKENRTIPPLRYDDVVRLKMERPRLAVEINGGITSMSEVRAHLNSVDAVMVGRAAYDDPFAFAAVDRVLFGDPRCDVDRIPAVAAMIDYVDGWVRGGGRAHSVFRHLLGAFTGRPGARAYRRILSTEGVQPGADARVLSRALQALEPPSSAATISAA